MAYVHAFLCHVSERTSEEANSEVDFPSFLRIKLRHVPTKAPLPTEPFTSLLSSTTLLIFSKLFFGFVLFLTGTCYVSCSPD